MSVLYLVNYLKIYNFSIMEVKCFSSKRKRKHKDRDEEKQNEPVRDEDKISHGD